MNLHHRLGCADHTITGGLTIAALDKFTSAPPETQILASAILFLAVCHQFQFKPTEALTYATNMVGSEAWNSPEFRAVKDYIEKEMTTP